MKRDIFVKYVVTTFDKYLNEFFYSTYQCYNYNLTYMEVKWEINYFHY